MEEALHGIFPLACRSDLGGCELYGHNCGVKHYVECGGRIARFVDRKTARNQLLHTINATARIVWKMCVPFFYISAHHKFEPLQDVATPPGNNIRFMYPRLARLLRLFLSLLDSSAFRADPVIHSCLILPRGWR